MKNYVKVTKIGMPANPSVPSATWDEYRKHIEDKTLPVDYVIEGYLFNPVKVGEPIIVDRKVRNNLKIEGLFKSTPVVSFDGKIANTANSKYLIEQMNYV